MSSLPTAAPWSPVAGSAPQAAAAGRTARATLDRSAHRAEVGEGDLIARLVELDGQGHVGLEVVGLASHDGAHHEPPFVEGHDGGRVWHRERWVLGTPHDRPAVEPS